MSDIETSDGPIKVFALDDRTYVLHGADVGFDIVALAGARLTPRYGHMSSETYERARRAIAARAAAPVGVAS